MFSSLCFGRPNGLKETEMKIAIIGSGNVGKALASSSLRAGHLVTISSNGWKLVGPPA